MILSPLIPRDSRDFLDTDMNYTKKVIGYISPLLSLVDEDLRDFLTRQVLYFGKINVIIIVVIIIIIFFQIRMSILL